MLCSVADVVTYAFGGDVVALRQLCQVPTWDSLVANAQIQPFIQSASSDVEVKSANKFGLVYSADPSVYPFFLRRITAIRSGYYLWLAKAKGQAMPATLKEAFDLSTADLDAIRDGKQGTGVAKPVESRVSAVIITDAMATQDGSFSRITQEKWTRL